MRQTRAIAAIFAGLALMVFAAPLAAQTDSGSSPATDATPLEISVTGDSAPGWVPSEQLALQAVELVDGYLTALDSGDYQHAYEMITVDNQKATPAAGFGEDGRKFNQLAGPLRRRRTLMTTWSKDPPGAPQRGIYVAFDVAAQFTNVDRQCGVIVLYQRPEGGSFKVLRSENYYMDNPTAQQIELSQSHDALVQAWSKISASCPKFAWDATP
jgi:hypothetical protein